MQKDVRERLGAHAAAVHLDDERVAQGVHGPGQVRPDARILRVRGQGCLLERLEGRNLRQVDEIAEPHAVGRDLDRGVVADAEVPHGMGARAGRNPEREDPGERAPGEPPDGGAGHGATPARAAGEGSAMAASTRRAWSACSG